MRDIKNLIMVVLALICVISGSVWVNAYTKKAADEAA